MKRDDVDLHAVSPEHLAIHDRLINWSRYVSAAGPSSSVAPMFRHYRSSEVWSQDSGIPTDPLDGHAMEKAVSFLPEKHRDSIRWSYVYFWIHPTKMCRYLAVNKSALAKLIHDGRAMLCNRSTVNEACNRGVVRLTIGNNSHH